MTTIVWSEFPEVHSIPPVVPQGSYGVGASFGSNKEEGLIESSQGVIGFLADWKDKGFWEAMYDKPFSEVFGDFCKEIAHATGIFILGNGDFLFLLPAIVLMTGTFIIGRNKYTKWIIPLWFFYFLSRSFFWMLR